MFMKYIYVIGTNEQVKIGYSKHPNKRLKQLQTGNMNKLQLFYQEEMDESKIKIIESLIHRDLKSKKSCGEWFNISPQEAINTVKFAKIRYDSDDSLEFYYKHKLPII